MSQREGTDKNAQCKAWDDIESDQWKSTYRTLDSTWYLDHGVKIERFDNGHIEIYNTMTACDFYEKVSEVQRHFFNTAGWEAGCYNVMVDTCDKKMGVLENMIRLAALQPELYEYESLVKRRHKLLKKKEDYASKLKKILQSL